MARVTVEDCVRAVPNRFELVALASQRAKDIAAGAQITVERDNDKNPVIALREIADNTINADFLREAVIQGSQRHMRVESLEDEEAQEKDEQGQQSSALEQELESFETQGLGDDSLSFTMDNLDVED